jgi:hypothetical protein
MQAMTDCVMDGSPWSTPKVLPFGSNAALAAYLVETMGARVLLVSADILESGKLTMHEGTYAGTVATFKKERAAIAVCTVGFQ